MRPSQTPALRSAPIAAFPLLAPCGPSPQLATAPTRVLHRLYPEVLNNNRVVSVLRSGYPSVGRFPSKALPIRTCVAPNGTACSRSAIIQADISPAVG